MTWKLYEGDCLEIMPELEDHSIDMILCDLPYGTTACKWDSIIPLEPLWEQYKRLIKDNGAIVLTASQPFTTKLISSNYDYYRYNWVWEKDQAPNFLMAKKQPLKKHEDICVFSKKQSTYNPQMMGNKIRKINRKPTKVSENYGGELSLDSSSNYKGYYPVSLIYFNKERGLHPTQKPVKLFEYLIKTYTNEGELVLDNCAGSGTTGVACENLNRNSILIEQESEYCQVIRERLNGLEKKLTTF